MLTAARPLMSERTHWYHRDGKPCHDIEGKNGLRPATLRDARKLDLVPSVTNVLRVMGKGPVLQSFLIEQACLAVLTAPRLDGESLDAHVARVLPQMDEERNAAAEFGTRVHNAIADYFNSVATPIESDILPQVTAGIREAKKFMAEHDFAIDKVETQLVGCGYAGTVDLVMSGPDGFVVWDWKTKKTAGRKVTAYDEWAMQLGAYAACVADGELDAPIQIMNCIVSVDEPGAGFIVGHPGSWYDHYKAFRSAYELWCYKNNYYPHKEAGCA